MCGLGRVLGARGPMSTKWRFFREFSGSKLLHLIANKIYARSQDESKTACVAFVHYGLLDTKLIDRLLQASH